MSAQTNAKIEGVDFRLEGSLIIVEYDLTGGSPSDLYNIDLKFISEKGQVILPGSTGGDIGRKIKPGMKKIIRWDVEKDRVEFSGILKAVVSIVPPVNNLGGPSNALLSVAVPGLGGYFVEENKIRPAVTTAVTLGLISYGIYQKTQENKFYDSYKSVTEPALIQDFYNKANSAHHKYLITTRIGAALWIADIIWVISKGNKNIREQKSALQSFHEKGLRLKYENENLQLGYEFHF